MAKKKAPLKVEYVPIGKLKPFAGNPRKNEEAVAEIVKSIEFYGYTNPILVRRANKEVIAGHTRLLALQETGATEAPVIYLDLTSDQARAYGIFDNKSTENTEWDIPKLVDLIDELKVVGLDLDRVGFTKDDLESMTGAFDIDSVGMPGLPVGDKGTLQQMTFTLHKVQAEMVNEVLAEAKAAGDFGDTGNENSNGNALARICERVSFAM